VFDLCDIFQEYNSGIKQDLPVVYFWLQYVWTKLFIITLHKWANLKYNLHN